MTSPQEREEQREAFRKRKNRYDAMVVISWLLIFAAVACAVFGRILTFRISFMAALSDGWLFWLAGIMLFSMAIWLRCYAERDENVVIELR